MTTTLYRKVSIASLIMIVSVFLSRVIGLAREMVIASVGGVSGGVDAYLVAFIIPEILNHIVASGFLSVTFIPIFSRYLVEDREAEGWRVFSLILNGFGSLLILFTLAAWIFAPELVARLAPGIEDPKVLAMATRMTRIIMPAQFFFFAGGLFMAVQFAKEQFKVPALAPLIYNIGIIAGGALLSPWLGMEGFSWGVLAGAFVGNFWIQYLGARRAGMTIVPVFKLNHPDLKRYILLTLPLMLGLTMTFSAEIFLKFFGSYLPTGSIAALNFGFRIMFILVGLFGQAVGVASFPFMARLVAENRMDEMNRLLNQTLRYLALVIPVSILFIVLRQEVVAILFERGQFDAAATDLTARVLLFLMGGAFAFAAQTVVVRGFYAMQDTVFPAVFGTVAVALSIPLYWYGMALFGPGGVALAISLSAALQVALLYMVWNRRSQNKGSRSVYRFYLWMILFSIPLGLGLEWIKTIFRLWVAWDGFAGSLAVAILTGVVFTAVVLSAGYGLRVREVADILDKVIGKLKRG